MEVALGKLLEMMAKHGPGFIVAAIFIVLYFFERRSHTKQLSEKVAIHTKQLAEERARNDKMSDKLIELSHESIRADANHTKAIEMLERAIGRSIK